MKKKHYKFNKKELKNLPINYRYFEHLATAGSEEKELRKQVSMRNIFMTSKKYVLVFYKPISKCF